MGKKAKCKQIKCIVIEEIDFKLGFDFEKYQFDKHSWNFGLVKFYKGKKDCARSMKCIKVGKINSRSIDMWTSSLEILTRLYGDLHSSILILWQYSSKYNELYCIIETKLTRTTTYLQF